MDRILAFLSRYSAVLWLSVLTLLAFVSRWLYMDHNPVGLDEPFSIFHAQLSVPEIIETLKIGNNPPGYEIFLHFWIKLFGISPLSVRFPSVIFSALTVTVMYGLARRLFDRRVAFLAASMLLLSTYQIYFSHEARIYPLFTLLTTLSFYLLIRIYQEGYSVGKFLALLLVYVLLVYSHYFALIVIFLNVAVFLWLNARNRKLLLRYAVLLLLLLLCYLPYVPVVWERFTISSSEPSWVPPVTGLGHLYVYFYMLSNGKELLAVTCLVLLWCAAWKYVYEQVRIPFLRQLLLYVCIPLCLITGMSLFVQFPQVWKLTSMPWFIPFKLTLLALLLLQAVVFRQGREKLVPVIWLVAPLLLMFSVSFYVPMFIDRYLTYIAPAFYLCVAAAVGYLASSSRFVSFIATGALLGMFWLSVSFSPEIVSDSRGIVQKMKELKTEKTQVLVSPGYFYLLVGYHYKTEFFQRPHEYLDLAKEDGLHFINRITVVRLPELGPEDNILFIDANADELVPGNHIYPTLDSLYTLRGKHLFTGNLWLYEFVGK